MDNSIGQSLFRFQAALKQAGSNMDEYLEKYYYKRWISDELFAALAIRTTFVNSMHRFFEKEGLFNLERLQLSLVTDPLAHDVEHVPEIMYKGLPYVMTHSMIYSKLLACHNPKLKGIYIDSPNIRLEIESPDRQQRGKYLIDFSQMDVEVKRNRGINLETYLEKPGDVKGVLNEDFEKAIDMFERVLIYTFENILAKNDTDLKALGVTIDIPSQPFPRFKYDDIKNYGAGYEQKLGREIKEQIFWVTGMLRENYDLVYPYLTNKGKVQSSDITSDMIYNYDICIKSIVRDTGEQTPALEILSGGIREWIYDAIIERLLDNKIIPEKPIIEGGNIVNIDKLGGYGPFLLITARKDNKEQYVFPDTFGGGIGVERTLYAFLRGPKIKKIDDITCFGKNPDSHQIYMF